MRAWLPRWLLETGDPYVVSLVRVLLGGLLLLNAARELAGLVRGPAGDYFHLPFLPEALVLPRAVFVALALLQGVLALFVIAGRFARPALLASAVLGVYLLLCDRLSYHHNRYALFLFSFLLAFAPCDSAFAGPRWRAGGLPLAHRPLWAQRLAQLQLSIIYVASGVSKLLDDDWRQGRVIGDRLIRSTSLAVARGVPLGVMEVLAHASLASALAKLAIFTELFLAVGLFLPRTRFFALWWGVMFHLTIELTSRVELFGWLTLTIYALFSVPTRHERVIVYDPERGSATIVARAVRWLDWLGRFDVRPGKDMTSGSGFAVQERDGSWAGGLLGWARIARATPILFPLAVPLFVLALPARRVHLPVEPA